MNVIFRPLAAILLLALFIAAGFLGGPANGAEPQLMRAMASIRAEWPILTSLMVATTNLGSAYGTLGLASAAGLWLLVRRKPIPALLLMAIVLLERALVELLKEWFGRPRPSFGVDWLPPSMAYPSGHSANSMTAFLATALVVSSPGLRPTAATMAILASILVGLSRIYLGVHWPTDVVGGWSLGLIVVIVAATLGDRLGILAPEPQHQIVGGHVTPVREDKTA